MIANLDLALFEEPKLLWFNPVSGRWVLDRRELHRGDCFQVRSNGKWINVRIELAGASAWYLIGFPTTDLKGLEARWS